VWERRFRHSGKKSCEEKNKENDINVWGAIEGKGGSKREGELLARKAIFDRWKKQTRGERQQSRGNAGHGLVGKSRKCKRGPVGEKNEMFSEVSSREERPRKGSD